jgi:hypothetical protein
MVYIILGIIMVMSTAGLIMLCNHFYYKGYKDCFKDQEKNREFGKSISTFKATIIK